MAAAAPIIGGVLGGPTGAVVGQFAPNMAKGLGRLGTAPAPPTSPPPITAADTGVQQAQAAQNRRRAGAMGYRSTLLASLTPNTPNTLKSTMGS